MVRRKANVHGQTLENNSTNNRNLQKWEKLSTPQTLIHSNGTSLEYSS